MERKMRKTILISFLVLFSFLLIVIPTSFAESDYEIVARNFLKYLQSNKEILSSRMIEANELDANLAKVPAAYLVKLIGGGYILISTSTKLTPIKGYSLKADFDSLPESYRKYILSEMEYNVRTKNAASRTIQGIGETQARWDFLLNYDKMKAPQDYTPDTYLLTTTWNQGTPYNKYLPEINGEKVFAGCVNIAMAQAMRYHSHPVTAQGVVSYEWNGQQLKAVLYRPYNWANMPNALTGAEPAYQMDEVAKLIRDLGIMNHTAFGLTNSSTLANIPGLIRHYGFSNEVMIMNNSDETLFFNTLRGEIDATRPVLLSFPGHMTVADGYSSDPTGKKIHVNMGWGGHDDDYYYLDQNVEAGGYVFSPNLNIYYNLKPCSGTDCSPNLEIDDSITELDVNGKFNFKYDVDEYSVYLKGATTISGSRGYGNQAFYISLYNSQNTRLAISDDTISVNLSADNYRVKVSLYNDSGAGYAFDDKDAYTVSLSTSSLTQSEKTSIDSNLDIDPVIYNAFNNLLLNAANQSPHKILVDVRDENGDTLNIEVTNTNSVAAHPALNGNVLSITPAQGATGIATKVAVKATANSKSVEKSFVVMVSDQDVAFGKAFDVGGIFENQQDYNTHKVILEGECIITGYNGYSNQAFYSSVLDANENTIISPDDKAINHSFVRGIYRIGACLKQNPGGGGSYYTYDPGKNDKYVLSIKCPNADDGADIIAGVLGIDLSGTATPSALVGDINGDNAVDLKDAILVLQVVAGKTVSSVRPNYPSSGADVNDDGMIGLEEVFYILQRISGLRQ